MDSEVAKRAGCKYFRKSRSTGFCVGVYRSKEAGIESDPKLKWATVCEPHGTVLCSKTCKDANDLALDTREWCEACRDATKENIKGKKKDKKVETEKVEETEEEDVYTKCDPDEEDWFPESK